MGHIQEANFGAVPLAWYVLVIILIIVDLFIYRAVESSLFDCSPMGKPEQLERKQFDDSVRDQFQFQQQRQKQNHRHHGWNVETHGQLHRIQA